MSWVKVLRGFAVLPGLTAGVLAGLLMTAPLQGPAGGPSDHKSGSAPLDISRLPAAELETLALDALTALNEKREADGVQSWGREESDLRQIRRGINNVRRLLPLGKKLTLQSLRESLKTGGLFREKRLIGSVRRVVLDPTMGNAAGVWEDDPSVIRIGPGYAPYLTSDDEAMLVLGHELTHVAARGGRLRSFIEGVSDVARHSAGLALDEVQKEELACDYTGAEVLKRYIALHPTPLMKAERFSRAFGYESRSERLAQAWQSFCSSYNGDPLDEEHLSLAQTFRVLPGLDPELRALIPDDAISARLCR